MRLVDDHDVVLGQDRDAGDGIDREQRVVGDDYVDLRGLGSRDLGEAVFSHRAPRLAEALARRDGELTPRLIGDAGRQIVAVAGLGGGRPLRHPPHLAADAREGERVEQLGVGRLLGEAGMDLVQAQVVSATLEDRETRAPAERTGEGVGESRQVALDELPLQRDGRGGDHHGAARLHRVPDTRHEIGQRLTGTRAGLYGEVFAGVDAVRDGRGHRQLVAPLLTAQCVHRGSQQFWDFGEIRHRHRVSVPTVTFGLRPRYL
ncbi:hypothetical protein L612_004200000200 [Rhodococcus rhodochrous J38]|nr:hypothetical protein L612_004200000200 [Rhodococcus rhodochrous J38]